MACLNVNSVFLECLENSDPERKLEIVRTRLEQMSNWPKEPAWRALAVFEGLLRHAAPAQLPAVISHVPLFAGNDVEVDALAKTVFNKVAACEVAAEKTPHGYLAQSFAVTVASPTSGRHALITRQGESVRILAGCFYGSREKLEKAIAEKSEDWHASGGMAHYNGVLSLACRLG